MLLYVEPGCMYPHYNRSYLLNVNRLNLLGFCFTCERRYCYYSSITSNLTDMRKLIIMVTVHSN